MDCPVCADKYRVLLACHWQCQLCSDPCGQRRKSAPPLSGGDATIISACAQVNGRPWHRVQALYGWPEAGGETDEWGGSAMGRIDPTCQPAVKASPDGGHTKKRFWLLGISVNIGVECFMCDTRGGQAWLSPINRPHSAPAVSAASCCACTVHADGACYHVMKPTIVQSTSVCTVMHESLTGCLHPARVYRPRRTCLHRDGTCDRRWCCAQA
jgi:hypothetical protein